MDGKDPCHKNDSRYCVIYLYMPSNDFLSTFLMDQLDFTPQILQTFDVRLNRMLNEHRLLEHVRSIPEGSIVLMAVFDSADTCGNDCQTSLGLVGAAQQGFGIRGDEHCFTGKSETFQFCNVQRKLFFNCCLN